MNWSTWHEHGTRKNPWQESNPRPPKHRAGVLSPELHVRDPMASNKASMLTFSHAHVGVVNGKCKTLWEGETSIFLCKPETFWLLHLQEQDFKVFQMQAWVIPTLFKFIIIEDINKLVLRGFLSLEKIYETGLWKKSRPQNTHSH